MGPLSSDFLRVTTDRDIQESTDRQAALALYQQQSAAAYMVRFVYIHKKIVKHLVAFYRQDTILKHNKHIWPKNKCC